MQFSAKQVTLVGDEGYPHPPKRLGKVWQDPCPTLNIVLYSAIELLLLAVYADP